LFDPQDGIEPHIPHRSDFGSPEVYTIVLNSTELHSAYQQLEKKKSDADSIDMAKAIKSINNADYIVVKKGMGKSFGICRNGIVIEYLPRKTKSVWTIGTGDCFAATLFYYLIICGYEFLESLNFASTSVAYFCDSEYEPKIQLPNLRENPVDFEIIDFHDHESSYKYDVYLAGPFFTTQDLWLVTQVKASLESIGMKVYSPYHELGIVDSFEIAKKKYVAEKNLQAIENSGCVIILDDHRDPGTLIEYGASIEQKKKIFIYSLRRKEHLNSMFFGSDFEVMSRISDICYSVYWHLKEKP